MRRGDVFYVRLDPTEGSEIRKTRPAVIISNDTACRYDSVVQIVPLTGLRDKPLRPYEARISSSKSGVDKPSRAVANQVRTVAKARLLEYRGHLTQTEMIAVTNAVALQLGIENA